MTLTKAAVYIKRGMFISLIVFILYYIIFFVLFPQARMAIARLLPEREPPNMLFGKLPIEEYEQKELDSRSIRYELDTRGGLLPIGFPKKMTVYTFKQPQFSYLAGTNAQNNAQTLGFGEKDLISDLKGDVLRWKNLNTGISLTIDLATRELIVDSDLQEIREFLEPNRLQRNLATAKAEEILNKLNRYDSATFQEGRRSIKYGKYLGFYAVEANEQETPNFAKITLSRKVEDYNVYGPDPREGIASVYVGYNSRNPDLLAYPKIYSYYKEIDFENKATYPIVFISDAWNNVKKGRGVIAGVYPKNENPFEDYEKINVSRIIVKDIYLAYYENNKKYHKYLQPMYVFEGRFTGAGNEGGDIYVYYPAITPEYLDSSKAD